MVFQDAPIVVKTYVNKYHRVDMGQPRKVQTFIPEPIERWWLSQFEANKALDPMSRNWWRERIFQFTAALLDGDENRPVAGLADTIVYGFERPHMSFDALEPLVIEKRGFVVNEAYSGQGLGLRAVEQSMSGIYALELGLETFASTRSPRARRVLKRAGGKPKPPGSISNQIACWGDPGSPDRCKTCPMVAGNALWWPKDNQ